MIKLITFSHHRFCSYSHPLMFHKSPIMAFLLRNSFNNSSSICSIFEISVTGFDPSTNDIILAILKSSKINSNKKSWDFYETAYSYTKLVAARWAVIPSSLIKKPSSLAVKPCKSLRLISPLWNSEIWFSVAKSSPFILFQNHQITNLRFEILNLMLFLFFSAKNHVHCNKVPLSIFFGEGIAYFTKIGLEIFWVRGCLFCNISRRVCQFCINGCGNFLGKGLLFL